MSSDERLRKLSPEQLDAVAHKLRARRRGRGSKASIPRRAPDAGPAPLCSAQRRLWFLQQLDPTTTSYNAPIALRLVGEVDDVALQAALDDVAARHPILRTRYPSVAGEPRQVVEPSRRLPLERVDLDADASLTEAIATRARVTFDLAASPPARAWLLRRGDDCALLLVLHHIACDGWTLGLLLRDLGACYRARRAGEAPSLAPIAIDYADYATWEQARVDDDDVMAPHRAFWTGELAGIDGSEGTLATIGAEAPASSAGEGAIVTRTFSTAWIARAKSLASEEGATLYMVLLSALGLLWHRYTGAEDIVVGSPVGTRSPRILEGVAGLILDTVPLRLRCAGEPSFRELLARVKATVLAADQHRQLPFDRLIDALGLRRGPEHPLFSVMFVLENAFSTRAKLAPELDAEVMLDVHHGGAAFDWTFVALERDDGLWMKVEYARANVTEDAVERALDHVERIVTQVTEDPNRRLGTIELLSPAEHDLLVRRYNATNVDLGEDCSVYAAFRACAEAHGSRIAVESSTERLSYGELVRRAEALASRLPTLATDDVVGVFLPRTVDYVVAIVGVLAAGGAWLPLDPSQPPARCRDALEEAGAVAVVTTPALAATLETRLHTVTPNGEPDSGVPRRAAGPEDLAYVIFTSGTTSRPKGVLLEQGALVNMARSQIHAWGIGPDARVLQFFSFAFDGAVSEMFMALLSGATLVMADAEERHPGAPLASLLRDRRITLCCLPPSVLAVLPAMDLPDLQVVLSGGEACTAELVDRWAPGRRFFNAYGPTEVTIGSSTAECLAGGGKPPLGRPFANRRMYVLDTYDAPQPLGVPGEIAIAGRGVGRGYVGAATAEDHARFAMDPLTPPGRMYRTGDQGRFVLRDGEPTIEFLGRRDHQVKLRGYRVELEAVADALKAIPDVRDAGAIVRRGMLVGYVTPATAPSDEAIRSRLAEILPSYMVPSRIVRLDAMPLNANGKIDRRRLPEAPVGEAGEAPRDDLEAELLAIWRRLFESDALGVTDDFFVSGGHSLLAARLAFAIEEALGRPLPLSTLLGARTVRALADAMRAPATTEEAPVTLVDGAEPAWVVVHALGGNLLCYDELRAAWTSPQRLAGLEVHGEPHATIEALAAHHVATLRARQPDGPYLLAGWSFGGVVAYETGRQLSEAGADVRMIALLDAVPHDTWGMPPDPDDAMLEAFFRLDLAGATTDPRARRSLAHLRHAGPDARRALLTEALDGIPPIPAELRGSPLETFRHHARAMLAYVPSPQRTPLLLIQAADGDMQDPEVWSRLAPVHSLETLPAGHHEVVSGAHAHRIAQLLETAAAAARAHPSTDTTP